MNKTISVVNIQGNRKTFFKIFQKNELKKNFFSFQFTLMTAVRQIIADYDRDRFDVLVLKQEVENLKMDRMMPADRINASSINSSSTTSLYEQDVSFSNTLYGFFEETEILSIIYQHVNSILFRKISIF